MSKSARQLAFVDLPMGLRFDPEDTTVRPGDLTDYSAPVDHAATRRGGEVRFEGVSKAFATPAGALTALDGVSFDVAVGEIFGIIGRSGVARLRRSADRGSAGLASATERWGVPMSPTLSGRRGI